MKCVWYTVYSDVVSPSFSLFFPLPIPCLFWLLTSINSFSAAHVPCTAILKEGVGGRGVCGWGGWEVGGEGGR